jgi:hypothetical protein
MPVLLKGENTAVYPTVDVETLVNEVRERLCLKNREKFCSNRRSTPYNFSSHRSSSSSMFEKCNRHYSSPESCSYNNKIRPRTSCAMCSREKKISSKMMNSEALEDPHVLLEKLLSEQSLIQEAVRRLQSQTAQEECSTSTRKFFPFVDEDSCDQFSNQTPVYSESEEDSVSQHSIDI